MAKLTVLVCAVCILFALSGRLDGYSLLDLSLEELLKLSSEANENDVFRKRRLTSGTLVSGCDYPGVVAITYKNKLLFTGIHDNRFIRVTDDSLPLMKLCNKFGALKVYGDDGTVAGTIAKKRLMANAVHPVISNGDGTSSIRLGRPLTGGQCPNNNAILYDNATMSVNPKTCKVVSYGGSTAPLHTFNSDALLSSPLSDNPLLSCCSYIWPNLLSHSPNQGRPKPSMVKQHYTCTKMAAGICNGDIGAPIFCTDSYTNNEVVVGMAGSGTCTPGEIFLSVDLTGGTLPGFST